MCALFYPQSVAETGLRFRLWHHAHKQHPHALLCQRVAGFCLTRAAVRPTNLRLRRKPAKGLVLYRGRVRILARIQLLKSLQIRHVERISGRDKMGLGRRHVNGERDMDKELRSSARGGINVNKDRVSSMSTRMG